MGGNCLLANEKLIPKIEEALEKVCCAKGIVETFRVQRYCTRVEMANE